jgi:Zn-dependent oligopeptidase
LGNFPKGSKKHPTLLSFSEVKTLFHEFGHACHNLLTKGIFDSQAGTEVVYDFVEVPSQLFEEWLSVPKILQSISKHYKTGEKIPLEMAEKNITHKNINLASFVYGQVIYTLLDQELHSGKKIEDIKKLADILDEKYGFDSRSSKSLFPAGFGHLVGYEASYYSYLYSLSMVYDFFARFEKEGYTNKKLGKELRAVLEKGGSYDEMTYIKKFLGRKPNHKAFMKALQNKK